MAGVGYVLAEISLNRYAGGFLNDPAQHDVVRVAVLVAGTRWEVGTADRVQDVIPGPVMFWVIVDEISDLWNAELFGHAAGHVEQRWANLDKNGQASPPTRSFHD